MTVPELDELFRAARASGIATFSDTALGLTFTLTQDVRPAPKVKPKDRDPDPTDAVGLALRLSGRPESE